MNKQRPVNLALTKFHFPPMAIVSIGHRISGVVLFLLLPLMIYLLSSSLGSPQHFADTVSLLQRGDMRVVMWIALCATLFHLIAGVRHLIMDFGFGESLVAARISAYTVFVVALILFSLSGVWLLW